VTPFARHPQSAHNALNALLYNTGGERKDFMLVLATNRAEDLDAAVLDRCDESLYFGLPDEHCRSLLIKQYFNEYVAKAADSFNAKESGRWRKMMKKMKLASDMGGEVSVSKDTREFGWLKSAVGMCSGFSGRELAKVMIAVQGVMYGEVGTINSKVVEKIISRKVLEHAEKAKMVRGDAVRQERTKSFKAPPNPAGHRNALKHSVSTPLYTEGGMGGGGSTPPRSATVANIRSALYSPAVGDGGGAEGKNMEPMNEKHFPGAKPPSTPRRVGR
jgi:hypothetical protein